MTIQGVQCCCVILNYNDWSNTKKLVENIRGFQSLDKILIVDNCSTDDSVEQLEYMTDGRTHLIVSSVNGGYGSGNMLGLKHAKEFLGCSIGVIANPDVEFSDACIKRCVDILTEKPERAVAAPVQLDKEGKQISQVAWPVPSGIHSLLSTEFLCRHTFWPYGKYKIDYDFPTNEVECVPGSLLVVDIERFFQVGGYDTDMFLYYEETSLGSRLKRAGLSTCLLTRETYRHSHSASIDKNVPSRIQQRTLMYDSLLVYLAHDCGWSGYRLTLAALLLKLSLAEERLMEYLNKHRKKC